MTEPIQNAYGLPDDAVLQRNPTSVSDYEEWVVVDPGTTLNDGSASRYSNGDVIRLNEDEQFASPDSLTFADRLREFSLGEVVPYLHMIPEIADSWKYNRLAAGMRDGTATPDERIEYISHLANQQRDKSFGYKAADIAINGLPYMIEFGIETYALSAIGGGATIGSLKAALVKGSGEAVEASLRKVAEFEAKKFATKKLRRAAEKALIAELKSTAATTAANQGRNVLANWGMRNLTKSAMETEAAKTGTELVIKPLTEKLISDIGKGQASSLAIKSALGTVDGSAGARIAAFFAGSQLDEFAKAAYGWNDARAALAAANGLEEGAEKVARQAAARLASSEAMSSVQMLAPRAVQEVGLKMGVAKTAMRPDQVALNLIDNMSAQYALSEDEKGNLSAVLMDEGDGFLQGFAKAFGNVAIENISEQSAQSFILLKGMFGPAATRALKASMLKSYLDKGVSAAGRRGLDQNQVLTALKSHLFGSQDAPGMLQKMGWNGVIAEMGEEAIGGALRMATGISKPGLPTLEDTAAMAVGFMFNPLAMGAYAKQAGAEQYVKMYTGTKAAIEELHDISSDIQTPGLQTEDKAAKITEIITNVADYYNQDGIHADQSMSKMQKMFRMLWLDRVMEAQAEYIGKNIGPMQTPESIENPGVAEKDSASNAIMRRVEWDMQSIVNTGRKVTPEDIQMIVRDVAHMQIMSEEEIAVYDEALAAGTAELQGALGIDTANRGIMIKDTKSTAPYLALKLNDTMSQEDIEELKRRHPGVIMLAEDLAAAENLPSLYQINKESSLDTLRAQAADDKTVISVGTLLGVPRIEITPTHGQAAVSVLSMDTLRSKINRKLDFIEGAWKASNVGLEMTQVPFRVVVSDLGKLAGQPISNEMKASGQQMAINIEASSGLFKGSRRVAFSEYSSDSAIAEDLLEDFFTFVAKVGENEQRFVHDWVEAEGERIKKEYPRVSAIQNATNLELVSKTAAVHLGYGPNAAEGSFKNVVLDNGIMLDTDFISKMNDEDSKATVNVPDPDPKKQGGIVSFLKRAHAESGGGHGSTMSTKEMADNAAAVIEQKEEEAKATPKKAKAKTEATEEATEESTEVDETSTAVEDEAPAEEEDPEETPEEKPEDTVKPTPRQAKSRKQIKKDKAEGRARAAASKARREAAANIEDQDVEDPAVIALDEAIATKEEVPDKRLTEVFKNSFDKLMNLAKEVSTQDRVKSMLRNVILETEGKPLDNSDAAIDPENQVGTSHSLTSFSDIVRGADTPFLGAHTDSQERIDMLLDNYTAFRKLLDEIVPKKHTDAGQRILWAHANNDRSMVGDIRGSTLDNIDEMIGELYDLKPAYVKRMVAIYKSITPLEYWKMEIAADGKVHLKQSNPAFIETEDHLDPLDLGKPLGSRLEYNGSKWFFYDVANDGRPGYLGSSHILETIKNMKRNRQAYGKNNANAETHVPYRMMDGVQEVLDDGTASIKSTTAKDLQSQHDLFNKTQRALWETNEGTPYDQGAGYWHIVTKLGNKNQIFMLYLPRHSAADLRQDAQKLYETMYELLDEAIAKEFYASPADLKEMSAYDFDLAINHANVIEEVVGDVSAFKNVEDFSKRMAQSGTPGVRLRSVLGGRQEVTYIVYDDTDPENPKGPPLFDGMTLYYNSGSGKGFGEFVDDQQGYETPSQVIKIFMNFRANGGTGSLHNYKPMASNVSQYEQFSRFRGIGEWMEANGIDLAIPLSSVKLGNKDGIADRVKLTPLYNDQVVPQLGEFDKANLMTMKPEDIIVGGNYNYPMQPSIRKALKQFQSVAVHYNGQNYSAYRALMNGLTASRARRAENLSLYDVIPYRDETQDDENRYGKLQKMMRLGVSDSKLLSGHDGELAYTHLTAEASRQMQEPVNRVMRTAISPGERTSDTGEMNTLKPLTVSEDGQFIVPATAYTNIDGGIYTEDIVAATDEDGEYLYRFQSKAAAIEYLEQNAATMMRYLPWMYRIDANRSHKSNAYLPGKPVINEHLIREWGFEDGTSAFTFSGELMVNSRVPLSAISFATLVVLDKRIGDGTASVIMTDAETMNVKSEDADADQGFLDLFPRNQSLESPAFRAHAYLIQAMQEFTQEKFEYMKSPADPGKLEEYVGEQRAEEGEEREDKHINTEAGQQYIREVGGDWYAPLGVSASTAPTLRFLNQLKVAYASDPGFKPVSHTIMVDGEPLIISRNQEDVDAMTDEAKLAHDQVWGNTMLQFILDSGTHGQLHSMGYNKQSVALLYAMATGSVHLSSEEDILKFAGNASKWLREADAPKEYITRRLNGEYDNQIFAAGNESFLKRHGHNGNVVKRLAEISSELFELTQHFSVSHDWPGNTTGFVNAMSYMQLPGEIFASKPFATSMYHNNSRMKAEVMKRLWAENPALKKLLRKDRTYSASKASTKKLFAARLIQAAQILEPDQSYQTGSTEDSALSPFWERLRSNPMVVKEYAKLDYGTLPYKVGSEVRTLMPNVMTMRKAPWGNQEGAEEEFQQALESLTRQEYLDLAIASALTTIQAHNEGTPTNTHNYGFFRHLTTAMAQEIGLAMESVDHILYMNDRQNAEVRDLASLTPNDTTLDVKELRDKQNELVERLKTYVRYNLDRTGQNTPARGILHFTPVQGLESAASKISKARIMAVIAETYEAVVPPMQASEESAAATRETPTSHSLTQLDTGVLQQIPSYYSTGWKIMLNHNFKLHNLGKAERMYHKVQSERLMRMAGMVKNIGWGLRKTNHTIGQPHYNKYALVNWDVRNPKDPTGFQEMPGTLLSINDAVKRIRELNKDLPEPTEAEKRRGHQVLQAAAARLDNPGAEYVANAVVFKGNVEGEENVKSRYYITYDLNHEIGRLGDKTGYATEALAQAALDTLSTDGSVARKKYVPAKIELGYEMESQKIDTIIDRFGAEKFEEIMTLAAKQIVRAETHAEKVWEHVFDEGMPDGRLTYKSIFAKLKRKGDSKYETIADAVAMTGEMPAGDGNIANVLQHWTQNTWNAMVKSSAIVMGTTTLDSQGDAAWMPEYNMDPDKAKFNGMNEKQMALSLKYAIDTVNALRDKSGKTHFVRDNEQSTQAEMNRLLRESKDILSDEYEQIKSTTTNYISSWWVKKQNKEHSDFFFGTGEKKMLQKIESTKAEMNIAGYNVLNGITRFNNWSKFMTLSVSFFHPFSLTESLVAMHGLNFKTAYRLAFQRKAAIAEMKSILKQSHADENLVAKWNKSGMGVNPTNPNIAKAQFGATEGEDMITRDIKWIQKHYGFKNIGKGFEWLKTRTDELLWNQTFPAMKLYSAEFVLNEMRNNYAARGLLFDEDKAMHGIAQMMDDAFGTQNLQRYIWSNPRVQQWLQMTAFAPDWTLSAFNVSGAPNLPGVRKIIRADQNEYQKEWQVTRYWPGMIGMVMFAVPMAMQALIYEAGAMLGTNDDDDTPFTMLNEDGMSGAAGIGAKIDMTPLLRNLGWVPIVGYKGGNTGKQRVYMELGKQAREVKDWFLHPVQTMKFKTSSAVQYAWERLTGTTVGGWEADDSAIVGLIKRFAPMSIVGPLEGRPTSILAPVKRGMTKAKATLMFAKSLKGYGDRKTAAKIDGNAKYRTNFTSINEGVLEAAAKNGVDPDSVVNAAKRIVISDYYGDFFKALNSENWDRLEEIANSIQRVEGTADRTLASVKARLRQSGDVVTPEQAQRIEEAFE